MWNVSHLLLYCMQICEQQSVNLVERIRLPTAARHCQNSTYLCDMPTSNGRRGCLNSPERKDKASTSEVSLLLWRWRRFRRPCCVVCAPSHVSAFAFSDNHVGGVWCLGWLLVTRSKFAKENLHKVEATWKPAC